MSPESESVSKIWCFPPWIRIEVEMQSGFRSSSNLSGIRKLNVSMWEVSYVFFMTKYSPFFKTLVRASFSTASLISQLVKNRTPVRFLGQEICWRRDRLPTPVFLGLPCGSAGKESTSMQETWVWSLSWEDLLEKGKATCCSILAWRIPWAI